VASEGRIVTRPFQLTGAQLIRVSSAAYLQRFWWFASIYPLFGAGLLLLTTDPLARYVGVIALLWPFTIPLRAVYTLTRARRISSNTRIGVDGDDLVNMGENGREVRRPIEAIKSVRRVSGAILLYTTATSYIVVPTWEFESQADADAFYTRVRQHLTLQTG
jgi:hypothetical protein